MLLDPECIPCIINQANNAARLFTNGNTELQYKLVKAACAMVLSINEDFTAPKFSSVIQSLIEKDLGIKNPYQKLKEENLRKVKRFIPYLQTMLENSDDKIEMAIRAAIAGNTIDYGANPKFNIEDEVNRITGNHIDTNSLRNFESDLENASSILYIGDNFEEALFDKILLKQILPKRIVFAVRSKAILNDITYTDAKQLGIDRLCDIIESGSEITGTDMEQCNPEFKDLFENADMVISKGQGNFETLMNEDRSIYFLFKVKCEAIARRCGLPVGTSALYLNQKKMENKL